MRGTIRALAIGVVLTVSAPAHAAVSNDAFSDALPIQAEPFHHTQVIGSATMEPGEEGLPCAFVGRTVWYRWTVPPKVADLTIPMAVRVSAPGAATFVGIYTGPSLAELTPVACVSDPVSGSQSLAGFRAIPGTTYHIQTGAHSQASTLRFSLQYGARVAMERSSLAVTSDGRDVSMHAEGILPSLAGASVDAHWDRHFGRIGKPSVYACWALVSAGGCTVVGWP